MWCFFLPPVEEVELEELPADEVELEPADAATEQAMLLSAAEDAEPADAVLLEEAAPAEPAPAATPATAALISSGVASSTMRF